MWASGRGSSAILARWVFGGLAAQVALFVEGAGPQDALWESLRVFLRHSGGAVKGHLKAASWQVLHSLRPLRVNLMPRKPTGPMTWPGGSSAHSLVVAVPSGREPGRCQGRLVRMVLLPPTPRKSLVLFSDTSLPSRLRRSVLSKPLPTGTAAHVRLSPAVRCGISIMCDMVTLRRLFARSKRGKACGIDGVRDDYCAIAPVEMANVYAQSAY